MCTEFILPKKSKKRISGRTLDFDDSFNQWAISGIPAGTHITAFAPGKQHDVEGNKIDKAYSWESQYDCVGIGLKYFVGEKLVLDPQFRIGDGINSQGLSASALWLPGTMFPKAKDRLKGTQLVSCFDIVIWVLSNYKDLGELSRDLEAIRDQYLHPENASTKLPSFWDPLQYQLGDLFLNSGKEKSWNLMPLHYQFHDKNGDSLVLEFRNGKMELTNNSDLGVLTNNPFLDWHRINLGNYISVNNLDTEEKELVGLELKSNGDGNSTIGLPASPLPSARFIRASYLLGFAQPWLELEDTTMDMARAYAFNLLGNVSVPRTMANQPVEHSKEVLYDYTQVIIVRDHENPELFLRTGYGIGTWSVRFSDFIKDKPICVDLKDLNDGVPYPVNEEVMA